MNTWPAGIRLAPEERLSPIDVDRMNRSPYPGVANRQELPQAQLLARDWLDTLEGYKSRFGE